MSSQPSFNSVLHQRRLAQEWVYIAASNDLYLFPKSHLVGPRQACQLYNWPWSWQSWEGNLELSSGSAFEHGVSHELRCLETGLNGGVWGSEWQVPFITKAAWEQAKRAPSDVGTSVLLPVTLLCHSAVRAAIHSNDYLFLAFGQSSTHKGSSEFLGNKYYGKNLSRIF